MPRNAILAAALGAALLSAPALAADAAGVADHPIILTQGGSGADSGGTGGLNSATPGSPAAGNLGSTPQEMLGRSEQPAQGAATTLVPTQGRGAPDPSATDHHSRTAPGGTAVMPGDRTRR